MASHDLETDEYQLARMRELYGHALGQTPCPTPPAPAKIDLEPQPRPPSPSLGPEPPAPAQDWASIEQLSAALAAPSPGQTPLSPSPNSSPDFDPAFGFDNLVEIWYAIHPETKLHPWQREELLRISGYVDGTLDGPRIHWFKGQAYRGAYVCANSSGKDRMLIATTAVGLPLLYRNVFVVITSSSHEQLKFQTENHIKRAISNLNARFGFPIYQSVEFYHTLKERGGEIKLFATDEAGRAEGWHPLTEDGRLVLIVNEAKSISPEIFGALDRCYGYSHWLEISSPGPRRGPFYSNFRDSVHHPSPYVQGEFYGRKVDYTQCPHITPEEVSTVIRRNGLSSYIVQTSLFANFYEQDEDVVIPVHLVESCETTIRKDGDIGIGLDSAAGNDETALVVRNGNHLALEYYFKQKDTTLAADLIHEKLLPYQNLPYRFNADDGGISRAMVDMLVQKGWKIARRLNQSPAFNKRLYLNLGAEMWFHARRLFEKRLIHAPTDKKLLYQLTTRKYDETANQGKKALQSKKEMRGRGSESPDRADAFVLAYYSFSAGAQPDQPDKIDTPSTMLSMADLLRLSQSNPNYLNQLMNQNLRPAQVGDYTLQDK